MAKRTHPLVKTVIALGALGVLGVLFVQSVRQTRAEPYSIPTSHLRNWTVVLESPVTPSSPLLTLRPRPEIAGPLFNQIFARAAESLSAPVVPGVPLLLQEEFVRFAGGTTPQALLAAAKEAGLEGLTVQPRCMGYRRESSPGVTRQLYFVLFDMPAFAQFRQRIAATAAAGDFDPSALSPVMLVGSSDPQFSRWLPLRADPERDCVAPVTVTN